MQTDRSMPRPDAPLALAARRWGPASAGLAMLGLLALAAPAWLAGGGGPQGLPAAALRAAGSAGVQASALAGAATGLGALALMGIRRLDERGLGLFMALSAGMMFAAAVFSLLLPAAGLAQWPHAADVVLAAVAGYLLMAGLDRSLPHHHPVPAMPPQRLPARALQLMVVAIAAHNLPEGFAVGAGFGGGTELGWATALSIGVQNVPEGLVVAAALWSLGLGRVRAALGALGTGLIEPFGALLGVLAVDVSAQALPLALGAAGGAMVFVVVDELIPVAFKDGAARGVPLVFAGGFFAVAALVQGL
jgi:ZIP family zinc transporter